MCIPLNHVNLNQVLCKRHNIKDDHDKCEFLVYGVNLVNMKKILTIRTLYLFVNKTLFNYDIHIRYQNSSVVKTLQPGDTFPMPESIDNCKFQIRISSFQKHLENDLEDDDKGSDDSVDENLDELKSLTAKNLQDLNKESKERNWSDPLNIQTLKKKLPLDKATFL